MEFNNNNIKQCGHILIKDNVPYSCLRTLIEGRKYKCQCCGQIVEGTKYVREFENRLQILNQKLRPAK